MVSAAGGQLLSLRPAAAPMGSAAFPEAGTVSFDFAGVVEGLPYPSLSPAQQERFKADFLREVASIRQWARQQQWPPLPVRELQVLVSDEYKIPRSLVPASIGKLGRMEFPAWKAVAGEAAIMHELVHVHFPNGNRLLAEGLAVYLQAKIGGNRAFPNFGQPLRQVVRELVGGMVAQFAPGKPETLEAVRISDLDRIATPSPLRLRVGKILYDSTPGGQAHIYPIAGSFIELLIESHGLERFRALYARTPLVPFARDAGSAERWEETYGVSLPELERQWRSTIADFSDASAVTAAAQPVRRRLPPDEMS
jgi:hypothetical protein